MTKSSSIREKTWPIHAAGMGFCVVLTLVGHYFGIHPLFEAHARGVEQRQELADRRDAVEQFTTILEGLKQRRDEIRGHWAQLPAELEPLNRLNVRLAQFTQLAADSGLTISKIVPGPAVATQSSQNVPIQLTGTGTYQSCALMLQNFYRDCHDARLAGWELASDPVEDTEQVGFVLDIIWHATVDPPSGRH